MIGISIELHTVATTVAIMFMAAVIFSHTSFGFGLVSVPLLTIVFGPKEAIVVTLIVSTILMIPLLYGVRHQIQVSRAMPLLLGSLIGLPLGLLILHRVEASIIGLFTGSVVIVASLALFFWPPIQLQRPHLAIALLAGVASGFLKTSTSMSGPPLVLYNLSVAGGVSLFRATLLAVFLPTSIITLVALIILDLITIDVLIIATISLPAIALGAVAGSALRKRTPHRSFRSIALAILIASAISALISIST